MKININRDSVCLGDDIDEHSKIICLSDDAIYEDLFKILIKEKYFPSISGNNVVWVLTTQEYFCVFSYFTKTNKISMGFSEKKLINICKTSSDMKFKYYTNPLTWKEKIVSEYKGDTYSMWRDGWLEEYKYCDYVMSMGME